MWNTHMYEYSCREKENEVMDDELMNEVMIKDTR